MLAFAAICVRGQTNLLPSNATPDAIADLQLRYPDSCVLRDAQVDDSVIAPATAVPSIAADHPADRKSVVEGKSVSVRVDLGGSCIIKKKTTTQTQTKKHN